MHNVKTLLLSSIHHHFSLRVKNTMETDLQKYSWMAWLTIVIFSQIYDCLQVPTPPKETRQIKRQNNVPGQRCISYVYFTQLSFSKSCFEMNSLQKHSWLCIKRTSAKGLQMLLFEIPWIIMGSSLFEMIYLMDFYYYFTFIESQRNNEHKANRKAWIGNLNSASVSIVQIITKTFLFKLTQTIFSLGQFAIISLVFLCFLLTYESPCFSLCSAWTPS